MPDPTSSAEASSGAKERPQQEQITRLTRVASRALDTRHTELFGEEGSERRPDPANPGEKALRAFYQLKYGTNIENVTFSDGSGAPLEVPADRVPGATAEDADKLVTITQIVRTVQKPDGSYVYEVQAKDAGGNPVNGGNAIELSRGDVAEAQLASERDAILTVFPDADDKVVVQTAIDGLPQRGEGVTVGNMPSDATLSRVENKYPEPVLENTDVETLSPERQRVAAEIRRLEEKGTQLSDQEKGLLANLKLAEKMQSGEAGDLFIYSALQQIQEALPKELTKTGKVTFEKQVAKGDQAEWQRLQDLMDNIRDSAAEQQKNFFDLLEGETSKKQLTKWQKLAQEVGGIGKIFTDLEFQNFLTQAKGEEVEKFLFGKEMTATDLKELLKDIQLSPELKKALEESGDKTSILKILLMVAAGIIAAPIVATGTAAFVVRGAASGGQH